MATAMKAPRTVIYDIDRGLKCLGTDEKIESVFGFKPRRFIATKSLIDFFNKWHRPSTITSTDALGECQEQVYLIDKKSGIQIEVLDSMTAFQGNTKAEVKGDAEQISLPMWGRIGEATEALTLMLARTDTDVIIIAHTKAQEDSDLGIIEYIPALSGRMKDEIGRHFDCVFFTHIRTDDKGGREYLWQVLPDERRKAGTRIVEIAKYAEKGGGYMPQDFKLLFELAGAHKAVKILILGPMKTGKTYSLRTLLGVTR